MKYDLAYRIKEAVELVKDKGFLFACRNYIYWGDETVLVEMDLSTLDDLGKYRLDPGLDIVGISRELFDHDGVTYPEKSEYFRALDYLKQGYRGFALKRETEVVGYIWYALIDPSNRDRNHPDVNLFGIPGEEGSAYMFSMYLKPTVRGKNLAVYLQRYALHHLRDVGLAKAYGTYGKQNLSALWTHRMLRWKESKTFRVYQFVMIKKAIAR
jgi:GNAT superfamily N-acetyltransferase